MRNVGTMASGRGYGCNDHACWAYSSRAERDRVAIQWLLDGADQGQRLIVVTDDADGAAQLKESFAAAASARNLGEDALFSAVDDIYDLSRPIDPPAQLAIYAQVVAQAISDGFNGVRVFADITTLISDPGRRTSHAAWEHHADAWMAQGNPLAPMCAYDTSVIPEPPEAILAVHPLRHRPTGARASFGLYWRDSTRVLDGYIDGFGLPALEELMAALPAETIDVDVRELDFLSASGAVALAAGSDGPLLRFVGASATVRRLWDVLGLDSEVLRD